MDLASRDVAATVLDLANLDQGCLVIARTQPRSTRGAMRTPSHRPCVERGPDRPISQAAAGPLARIRVRPKVRAVKLGPGPRVRRRMRRRALAFYRALLDAREVAAWRVPDGMTARVHAFDPHEGGASRSRERTTRAPATNSAGGGRSTGSPHSSRRRDRSRGLDLSGAIAYLKGLSRHVAQWESTTLTR